jgi:hypothetical protein
LIVADELALFRITKRQRNFDGIDRAPSSLVADHARSPRKRCHRFLESIDSVVTAASANLADHL